MRIRPIIFFLLISFMTFHFSCQTDDLGDPGDDVSKFIGTWSVSDQPARVNYQVKIERDPVYEDQVYLQNFADAGGSAVGRVIGNTIVIDKQAIGSDYNAEGSGQYEKSDRLVFEFDLDDGIDSEGRVATYTK